MAISEINTFLFSDLSAVDGQTLSNLSHVDGLEIESGAPTPLFEFRADQLTAGNNNPIDTWLDNVGSNDLTAAGSTRPTQRDNTLNGLPTAEFDGTDDAMTLTTVVPGSSYHTCSIFAVMKCTDGGTRTVVGSISGVQLRINSSKVNLLNGGVLDLGTALTTLSTSVYYTIGVTYDNGPEAFYLNGATDGSGTASASTFAFGAKYMGVRDVANEYFKGNIAHLMFWDTLLTAPEITVVNDYLRAIWATW